MKIAVIGSGIWGACTAYHLNKEGADVELYDMWGAGNSRSGSGGASRIIGLHMGMIKFTRNLLITHLLFGRDYQMKVREHFTMNAVCCG